jgi:hypothetical protein
MMVTGKKKVDWIIEIQQRALFKKDMSENATYPLEFTKYQTTYNQTNNRRCYSFNRNNTTKKKIDSLKVLNNTFLASKDTLGTGFNQVKGLKSWKILDGKLHDVVI